MNFDRKDQSTDQLFKEKLENLDFGPQEHLWAGIEKALDENSSNKKLFGLPWIANLIIGLSLVSFSLMASYKYGYYVAEKKSEEKIKTNSKSNPLNNQNSNALADSISLYNDRAEINDYNIPQIESEASLSGEVEPISNLSVGRNKTYAKQARKIPQSNNSSKLSEPLNSSLKLDKLEPIALEGNIEENQITPNDQIFSSPNNQWASTSQRDQFDLVEPLDNRTWLVSKTKRKKSALRNYIKDDPCNLVERHVKRDRIYLDFYFAPEISKRSIVAVYPNSKDYADKRIADEKFVRSHSMGVRGSYVFKNGLALRTGFNYSEIKERFNYVSETQLIQIIRKNDKGEPIDTVHQEVDIVENIYNYYKFYDLPFVLGYEIDLADFVFSVNGGVAVNLMTKRSGFIYEPDSKEKFSLAEGSLEGNQFFKNNVGMSLVGSFGLNYKMSRGLMLLAEPSLRYYLGSITTDKYPLKQNYIQFGLIAGLRYQFIR